MRKLKLLSLFVVTLFATSMWAADPIGCVDVVRGHDGSIYIEGWAFDQDNTSATLEIHVYMYKSGVAEPVLGEGNTRANVSRTDVDNAYHCGANHGFSRYISTGDVPAGDYWINVFAINAAGTAGGNIMLHAATPTDKVDFHFTLKSPLTISYNANSGSGAPAAQQKRYGININLQAKGSLARTGYTTDGWATSAGGNKAYNFGASYSGNASTTLYAHWNIVTYTITYNLNGGSVNGNPTSYNVTTNTITLKNPTRTGYTFTGWTGSNGSTPQTEVSIAKGSTENKSYTANWIALKPCELSWMNVPEGGVVGTIGHEDEIVLPQINASQDFILAYQASTVSLRLGSTDESVLKVFGFNNFQVIGVGECDVYAVHDEDEVFAYDSAAFHVTVNPEPGPAPTVWTSLKVGDVIKVGDKIEVPVGDEWGINYNVLRDTWGPYELIRADILQEHEYDDPVVTETADGAYYVFKAENSTFYPLSNLEKGGLPVTETSDGLEVTAAEEYSYGKEYIVAVHDDGGIPSSVGQVPSDQVPSTKILRDGVLYILHNGTMYNVQGSRVR